MNKKLKAVLWIIGIVVVLALVITALVVTGGQAQIIGKLYRRMTSELEHNVNELNGLNEQLSSDYEELKVQERIIIDSIKQKQIDAPPEIDRNDYKSMLKWYYEVHAKINAAE